MQIAQLNVARMLAPLDSATMAEFVAALGPVNAAADDSPGFVWRLVGAEGADATAIRIGNDDLLLVNLSVWSSAEDLAAFVFREQGHADALRRRREWFDRSDLPGTVLWWVPDGHTPSVAAAWLRLRHLREHGSTPYAFGLRLPVPAPGDDSPTDDLPTEDPPTDDLLRVSDPV